MAHSVSAKKRIRQNETHRARNRWRLKTMRDAVRDLNETMQHGAVDDARAAARKAFAIIDRTAQKGVIHKNAAARKKSRLNTRLKAMAQAN